MLDFDFEKLCSVTMSNQNVYACLVCGKYFQGRGRGTHAYTHSLEAGHHVYINLNTLKVSFPSQPMALLSNACVSASFLPFQTCPLCVLCQFYCLPDNYEVIDSSLDDIKVRLCGDFGVFCALSLSLSLWVCVGVCGCGWVWVCVGVGVGAPVCKQRVVQLLTSLVRLVFSAQFVLYPVYSKDYIKKLDQVGKYSRALDGTRYLPGKLCVCVCMCVVCLFVVCVFVCCVVCCRWLNAVGMRLCGLLIVVLFPLRCAVQEWLA